MRRRSVMATLGAAVSVVTMLSVNACRVGYPFRGPGYDGARGVVHPRAGARVLVAVTRADIAPGRRGEFAEQLRRVLATMNDQEGLIGYAVRRDLVGPRVWTLTAWIDRESMERFVRSPAHRRAIAEGGLSSGSFVSALVYLEPAQVPLPWPEAERLVAEEASSDGGSR